MHDKLFLTKDTNVMANELEINHPAVNVLVDGLKAQNSEQGDGTNFVVTFGGELMNYAGKLVSEGLHVADVSEGYDRPDACHCPKTGEEGELHRTHCVAEGHGEGGLCPQYK